jgi:hypothetical protein
MGDKQADQNDSPVEDFLSDKDFEEFLKKRSTPIQLTKPAGDWISARHARELIAHYTKVPLSAAEQTLYRRAARWVALQVHTFTRTEEPHDYISRQDFFRDKKNPSLTHFTLSPLPADWEEVREMFDTLAKGQTYDGEVGIHYSDWASGDFKISFEMDFSIVTLEIMGLSLDEHALLKSIGVAPSAEDYRFVEGLDLVIPPETERPVVNAPLFGGRPRYGWWEDALADIAAMLYNGDLKPSRQKDIEEALANWLQNNGHGASETSIAIRARKIFRAISRDDERP